MRSLVTYAVAATAALGLFAASALASQASLASCNWQPIGQFPNIAPRALAVTPDGGLILAGDDLSDPVHTALTTMRWDGPGSGWHVIDRYLPSGSNASGARSLLVDRDGNAFVLAWEMHGNTTDLILRRSFAGGDAGSWETSETRWTAGNGGALASDTDGRIYVAYGFADASGVGWRVESALRGMGAFRAEDEQRSGNATAAIPQTMQRAANGSLYVATQLNGSPDTWVVRARQTGGAHTKAAWQTIDTYSLAPNSYGLAPRAIVTLANRILVAGYGVRGAGADDYQWIERWQSGNGRWQMRRYQVESGRTTMAQDAVATPGGGAAVLGVGITAHGMQLVLRESGAAMQNEQIVLAVDGITDLSAARIAIGSGLAGIVASVEGKATVLRCALR